MKAKPFIVVVCCLFMLLLFAGGMISENDLTPDTPPATQAFFDDITPLKAPAGRSGSGCFSPYVVKPGDTLSKIAQACGLTLNELLAANSSISNPNLIRVDQELRIPFAAQPGANPLAEAAATVAAQQQAAADGVKGDPPAGVLTTGGQAEEVAPAETSVDPTAEPSAAPAAAEAAAATPVPVSNEIPGPRVGDLLPIEIHGMQAGSAFRVEYGTSGGKRYPLGDGESNAQGVLHMTVKIPPEARAGEQWLVYAYSLTQPDQVFSTQPFQIGGTAQ